MDYGISILPAAPRGLLSRSEANSTSNHADREPFYVLFGRDATWKDAVRLGMCVQNGAKPEKSLKLELKFSEDEFVHSNITKKRWRITQLRWSTVILNLLI